MIELISPILLTNNLNISVAESCTSGALSSSLTNIQGSSFYFEGGIVVYNNRVKEYVLGVSEYIIDIYGEISENCAVEMAEKVKQIFQTDIAISVTGDLDAPYEVFYCIKFRNLIKTFTLNISNIRRNNRQLKKEYIVNHILNSLLIILINI